MLTSTWFLAFIIHSKIIIFRLNVKTINLITMLLLFQQYPLFHNSLVYLQSQNLCWKNTVWYRESNLINMLYLYFFLWFFDKKLHIEKRLRNCQSGKQKRQPKKDHIFLRILRNDPSAYLESSFSMNIANWMLLK